MKEFKLRPIYFLGLMLLMASSDAHAHPNHEEVEPFISGVVQQFITPSHVLILLGIGFLAGQQSSANLKRAVRVFASVSGIALMLTIAGLVVAIPQSALISIALIGGILVALEVPLSPLATTGFFVIAASTLGFDFTLKSDSVSAAIQLVLEVWLSLIFFVFGIAGCVSRFAKKQWQKIGIRIIGSWIIAISLLVLAFSFRK